MRVGVCEGESVLGTCVYVRVCARRMHVGVLCLTFEGSLWKSLSWKWTRSCRSCVQTTSMSLSNTWLQYLQQQLIH